MVDQTLSNLFPPLFKAHSDVRDSLVFNNPGYDLSVIYGLSQPPWIAESISEKLAFQGGLIDDERNQQAGLESLTWIISPMHDQTDP
ncbi:hypothetical protein DSO57_1008145 [Entomophthora muscae]|uniref:Uncharacterized protein n=1 Tax=Entomophthora muscae TaxID=34485 RepID=A0ACC2SJX2_9FUNG|nr:hypothetical protein DSO57_1008145 [Entomophthora muscae]